MRLLWQPSRLPEQTVLDWAMERASRAKRMELGGQSPGSGVCPQKASPPPSELCGLSASSESASGRETASFS
jgi:hypothetical protein